jgi:hypothetical protein
MGVVNRREAVRIDSIRGDLVWSRPGGSSWGKGASPRCLRNGRSETRTKNKPSTSEVVRVNASIEAKNFARGNSRHELNKPHNLECFLNRVRELHSKFFRTTGREVQRSEVRYALSALRYSE